MSGLQQEELDVYGFPLTGATQQQRSARAACAAYEARRRVKWQIYVQNQQLPTGPTLKRYCRKGVPHELRGWVWWHVSGAAQAAAAAPGHYEACKEAGQAKPAVRQIELDLPRTFPRHTWLSTPEGQTALRDVLTAYAGHNPDVGYCQGMNFLVGLLLLAVDHDCYRTFWLMVALLEQVLYPGTYAPNLDGCHVEMGCLGQLLQQKQPKLAAHLQAIGCETSLVSTDWFMCLFATSLPSESAARVWDALFSEGRKVLHRLGLALMTAAAPQLMKLDNAGEVLHCVKTYVSSYHDRDQLLAAAFKGIGGLPRARIAKLQQAEAAKVSAMLAARAATKNKQGLKKTIAAAQQLQQQHFETTIESGSDKQQQSEAAEPQQQGRSTAEQLATGAAAGMTAAAGSVRSGLSKAYESLNAYTGGKLASEQLAVSEVAEATQAQNSAAVR